MCRMIAFGGTCPRCAGVFSWTDLTQQLSCLEAKNAGSFGRCHRGVHMEEHTFNQECDSCAAEIEADECYFGGGLDDFDYNVVDGIGKQDYLLQPSSAAAPAAPSAAASKTKASGKGKAKEKKLSSPDPRLEDGRRQKRQRTA